MSKKIGIFLTIITLLIIVTVSAVASYFIVPKVEDFLYQNPKYFIASVNVKSPLKYRSKVKTDEIEGMYISQRVLDIADNNIWVRMPSASFFKNIVSVQSRDFENADITLEEYIQLMYLDGWVLEWNNSNSYVFVPIH